MTYSRSTESLSVVLMALLALLVALPASAEWHRYSDTAMTTPVELEFWADESVTADVVAREVFDVFHRVDIQMSRYRADSELSALNREAGKGPVNVSDGLFKVLQKAREVSELSEGAFDVTFGSVGYLYDFRAGKQPTDEQVATGLTRHLDDGIMPDPIAKRCADWLCLELDRLGIKQLVELTDSILDDLPNSLRARSGATR